VVDCFVVRGMIETTEEELDGGSRGDVGQKMVSTCHGPKEAKGKAAEHEASRRRRRGALKKLDRVQWEYERRWIGLPRQRKGYMKVLEEHVSEPEAQKALAQAHVFEEWVREKRRWEREEERKRALFFETPQVEPRVASELDFLDNWCARLERKWAQ